MKRTIRVINPARHKRQDVFRVVVPIDPGSELPSTATVNNGTIASVESFGGRDQAGLVQFARLHIKDVLEPLSTKELEVNLAQNVPTLPFQYSDRILHNVLDFKLELSFDGLKLPFRRMTSVHSDHLMQVFHFSTREIDSLMWADVFLEIGTTLDHIKFNIVLGASDTDSAKLHELIDSGVKLRSKGAVPVLRFSGNKGIATQWNQIEDLWELNLLAPSKLADGQAQSFEGVLLFALPDENYGNTNDIRATTLLAEVELPVQAVSMDWENTWGPWKTVPRTPGLEDPDKLARKASKLAVDDFNRLPKNDPWAGPVHGCSPRPANTGTQADFGVGQLYELLEAGQPAQLYPILQSVLQETCRPGIFVDQKVDPLKAIDHPSCRYWKGRPHFDKTISPDQLGKTRPYKLETARSQRGETWHNHDNEHQSYNWMAGYALATGHNRAVWLCKAAVERWLLEQPRTGGLTIQPLGNSRAVGRVLSAGAWLYLATGDSTLRTRLEDRVKLTLANQWHGAGTGNIKVLTVLNPDPRTLPVRYWSPWMEAIGVYGLSAVHEITGLPVANSIAQLVSRTVAMHGFHRPNGEDWMVGYAISENGQQYLTEEEKSNPGLAKWTTNLDLWAMPAIILGRKWAEEAQDQDWLDRCEAILAQKLEGRDGWDMYTPWMGVK